MHVDYWRFEDPEFVIVPTLCLKTIGYTDKQTRGTLSNEKMHQKSSKF